MRFPTRTSAACLALITAATCSVLAPTADAAQSASAAVRRGTAKVGTATALIAVPTNGWGVVDATITGFLPPEVDKVWRTRTAVKTSCADAGFDPEHDDAADAHLKVYTSSSTWRLTRVRLKTGTLLTNDLVATCPSGQSPTGSFIATIVVRDLANTKTVGSATLVAAG